MRRIFSLTGLIRSAVAVLLLIGIFLIFKVLPFFQPLFRMAGTVLIPLFLAMVVAYLLHPLVELLTKLNMKRSLAILCVYIVFFGGLLVSGWLLFPALTLQVRELMERLPEVEEQLSTWYMQVDHRVEQLPRGLHQAIDRAIHNLEDNITGWITGFVSSFSALLSQLLLVIVVPFFAFYLLADIDKIRRRLLLLIPRSKRKMAIGLWRDIDRNLGEYIRGQLLVSFFVFILALIGYSILGLPYALFLGLVVGITNIIPYFGPILGTVVSGTVALVTNPKLIIWVILVNVSIQLVEGNILNPYIMGKRLQLHPMLIIIVLLVGADVGGLIGLLFAVPVFVIFKVLVVNTVLYIITSRAPSGKIDKLSRQ